jgi:uncharacterized protein (DUF885 family)
MRRLSVLLTAAALFTATPALAGASEDFQALQNDFWAEVLRSNPLLASSAGVTTYDRELAPLSLAEMDRQATASHAFLTRLDAIPATGFSDTERANAAILRSVLQEAVEMNRFGQRQLLYSTLGSYHGQLASMADSLALPHPADYRNYLARLALVPDRMRAYGELSAKAAREGFVQPCVTMTRFPETITGVVTVRSGQVALLRAVRGAAPGGDTRGRVERAPGAGADAGHRSHQPSLSPVRQPLRHAAQGSLPAERIGLRPAWRPGLLCSAGPQPHDTSMTPTRSTSSAWRRSSGSGPRWSRWPRTPASRPARR